MIIKLCYKEYPFKMSIGAIKEFKQSTGLDLWYTLITFLEAFVDSKSMDELARDRYLNSMLDFEDAAVLFHTIIRQEDKSIPLEEIQDAMFRVGWRTNENTTDMSEPYPKIMAKVAFDVDDYFQELSLKKKTVTLAG